MELLPCIEALEDVVLLSTKTWKLPLPVPVLAALTIIVQALPTMLKMPPGEVLAVVAVLPYAPMASLAPVRVTVPLLTESVPLSLIYAGRVASVGSAE